jgi:pyruvate/2-oxoglutarate dehydrogenase complex dihydrolipoamide dehydrogenase (E3) component
MKFDVIVIGAGQAAKPLSYALADLSWKVAFIERAELGGTCVNTGCTPTKTMVASAQVAHYARDAAHWGVRASNVSIDLPAVVARKNSVVQNSRDAIQKGIDQRPNIRLVHGHARFVAPHQVQVGNETFEAARIFIDTGTRPKIPKIPGIDSVPFLTNASIMELLEVPKHLIILGGGYIGLEFGQMFRRFGSQVTIVHTGQRLPRMTTSLRNCRRRSKVKAFHSSSRAAPRASKNAATKYCCRWNHREANKRFPVHTCSSLPDALQTLMTSASTRQE